MSTAADDFYTHAQATTATAEPAPWESRITVVPQEWYEKPAPPRQWLLRDSRHDNEGVFPLGKVGLLGLPVLYVHGTQDEVVPFDMGRKLFAATPSAVGLVNVAGGGHDDNALMGGSRLLAAIDDFVRQAPPGGRIASGPE